MKRNYRGRRNNKRSKKYLFIDDKKFIKYLSFLVIFLFIFLVCIAGFYGFKNFISHKKVIEASNDNTINNNVNVVTNTQNSTSTDQLVDSTFTLSAIGNIMSTNSLCKDAYVDSDDEYDFFYVFNDIYRYIKLSDIAVGNFNSNFAGIEKGFENNSTFNSPDSLGKNLKRLGIDILSTANYHSLDMGFDGLSRTIDILNSSDIPHVGTYTSR